MGMAVPGICTDWLQPEDICADEENIELAQAMVNAATSWVFRATCSQFTGICTSEIRPASTGIRRCGSSINMPFFTGDRLTVAADSGPVRMDLTPWVPGVIREIDAVFVDGDVIDPENYWLANGRWLVPLEDGLLWPWPTQNLNLPSTEDSTWEVLVTHGNPPPAEILEATADLARELLAKCTGGACNLPDNATSLTKDGMSIQLSVPTDGKTGLPFVDSVMMLYPCASRRRMLDPAQPMGQVLFNL
jgi:hypothetical protein